MKIQPIDYSASYESVNNWGLKRWEKISIGATISEDEDPIKCLQELKDKVEQFHRESNKTLSIVADNVPVPEVQVEKEQESYSDTEQINKCETLDELKGFEVYVSNKPILKAAYFIKHAQLTKDGRK